MADALRRACVDLKMSLLDLLMVSHDEHYSFRELGVLPVTSSDDAIG